MTRFNMHADAVLQAAQGRFQHILGSFYPQIDWASFAERPRVAHDFCPLHTGESGKAFRPLYSLGRDSFHTKGATVCNTCGAFPTAMHLLMQGYGFTYPEALEHIWTVLNGSGLGRAAPIHQQRARPAPTPEVPDELRIRWLLDAWNGAVPLTHPSAEPARRYLISRGVTPIHGELPVLRFHPRHYYGRSQFWPALLGMIQRADGSRVSINRIYLTPEGQKAPVEKVKSFMLFPSDRNLMGAAVPLDAPGPILHVCEGIETALAVRRLVQQPVWACLVANMLQAVELPACVRFVGIWGDMDVKGAGQRVTGELAARLRREGRRAIAILPPPFVPKGAKGIDWLDVINDRGVDQIRSMSFFTRLMETIEIEFSGTAHEPSVVRLGQ